MNKIAVIIPCHRCAAQAPGVVTRALAQKEVWKVYIVDDACPEGSGAAVERQHPRNDRTVVIRHERNQGVGGAMVSGYRRALEDGADIMVKIDGDGQMAPELLPAFLTPLLAGEADYAKGNRFYSPRSLGSMPLVRLLGNSVLSFAAKAVTGYWHVMDPNNGYTAVHRTALTRIDLSQLAKDYFFETDLLFRLYTARAVVTDVPMEAVYGDERSGLRISRILLGFPPRYVARFAKRLAYTYFVRDFNAGSLQALLGAPLLAFGAAFGAYHWRLSHLTGLPATSGTVMVAAMPVILGFQLLLSALSFDVANVPARPLQRPAAKGI